ncbi:MAG: DNA primase [Defluviitaleaceae bacterium]|nr:DNA primase [Defluviitaleaceae bacterium]
MFYEQDTISEVKNLNDIVDVVSSYVKLSPRSGNHFGLCPFHSEKSPSFSVNRDKQIFYCFGCGAGGNVITFIRKIENMDFVDALKLLADRVHFNLPQKRTSPEEQLIAKQKSAARETALNLNKLAARFFYENLHADNSKAQTARKFLENRGLSLEIIKRFGLGFSLDSWDALLKKFPEIPPEDFCAAGLVKKSEKNEGKFYDRFRNRLMFPIIDTRNRVIGFGGRVMEGDSEAKYLNSPETELFKKRDCLYGLNLAKKTRSQELIIVEGYMDVLAMHQHGFANTAGVLGTAFKDSHTMLFGERSTQTLPFKSVTLILDSDSAGIRASVKAISAIDKQGFKVKVLEIPDAKDPDEYLSRFGARKFANILSSAKTFIDFLLDLEKKSHDLTTIDGKIDYTHNAAKILAPLKSFIETEAYVKKISKDTEISLSAINMEIDKIRGKSGVDKRFSLSSHATKTRNRGEDSGLKNAVKELLRIVITFPKAAKALKKSKILSAEEMNEKIYGKLLDLAFDNAANSPNGISPSDIVDLFETDEEHQIISEIFAETHNETNYETKKYASDAALEKALCDMAKKIKLAWLNQRIEAEKNDLNAVNSILSQVKSINALNISLHDG